MNVAMNVLFIGGGNMADALIGGMLKSGFAPAQLRDQLRHGVQGGDTEMIP